MRCFRPRGRTRSVSYLSGYTNNCSIDRRWDIILKVEKRKMIKKKRRFPKMCPFYKKERSKHNGAVRYRGIREKVAFLLFSFSPASFPPRHLGLPSQIQSKNIGGRLRSWEDHATDISLYLFIFWLYFLLSLLSFSVITFRWAFYETIANAKDCAWLPSGTM